MCVNDLSSIKVTNLNVPYLNVLLIKDDHDKTSMIVDALKENKKQINIYACQDMAELTHFIETHLGYMSLWKPFIIFLDLDSSFTHQRGVLQFLKQNERTKGIPTIVFSSTSPEMTSRYAYQNQAGG